VLITGESGTGKELVARAIYQHGPRAQAPFLALNCAAIPENLLESELFGHEKGAFTGANTRSAGRFEQAEGGTLFLDEIGDMPMEAQTRLLRVLQQGEYTTVGGRTPIKADVRIIAATNKDLRQLIQQGLFREDLFFRLNVVPLRLPPLRERREDIPALARYFLERHSEENRRDPPELTPEVRKVLLNHDWPGNVRELENTVNRLAIFAPTGEITLPDVEAETQRTPEGEEAAVPVAAAPDRLMELERQHILEILKQTGGNRSEAARRLGIERKTLYRKALRLGIDLQATGDK